MHRVYRRGKINKRAFFSFKLTIQIHRGTIHYIVSATFQIHCHRPVWCVIPIRFYFFLFVWKKPVNTLLPHERIPYIRCTISYNGRNRRSSCAGNAPYSSQASRVPQPLNQREVKSKKGRSTSPSGAPSVSCGHNSSTGADAYVYWLILSTSNLNSTRNLDGVRPFHVQHYTAFSSAAPLAVCHEITVSVLYAIACGKCFCRSLCRDRNTSFALVTCITWNNQLMSLPEYYLLERNPLTWVMWEP